MAEKRNFHRSRVLFILSGIVLVILCAGFFFWRIYKYKVVNKKLDKLVAVKSRGLYQISYKNLIINEALGNISAENVEILPDSLVYKTLQDQKTAPENLFFINIPKLIITGVKTPKALLNREISGHIMKIENAHIEIRLSKGKKEEQPSFREFMDNGMYRQLLGNLKSIRADSVILENASLSILDKESKTIRCKAGGLSFRFSGIAIDSLNQNDSSRILFSKDLAIHCTDLVLPFGDKAYNLEISGIDFNSRTESFHTGRIKLKPRLSETDFAKSHKYSIDRFDFTIGSLDIRHISRPAFLQQELVADTFQINEASFRTFRDLSYPYDSVDRTHTYPQEAIMLLPIQVYIKKLLVKDSYIEYKEKNDKSDSSGKIAFFHVQAGFDNVTNMPPRISQNNLMRLNFKASFLDESPFSANIRMRLNNREGVFNMDAELGEMNATSLNPLLKPIALAELEKGKINHLNYHLGATNTHGKGKLIITYENLSLKLLKKDNAKNKYKTKILPTLATGLILKDSNPKNGKTRPGDIDYTRDVHRSIFNLMWKSLFAAIKKVAM